MKNDKIVDINGHKFDSVSGLSPRKPQNSFKSDISGPRRLVSDIGPRKANQPTRESQKTAIHSMSTTRKVSRNFDIARSNNINRFAPNTPTNPVKPITSAANTAIPRFNRPSAMPNNNTQIPKVESVNMIQKSAKEAAIAEAFANLEMQKNQSQQKAKKRSKLARIISFVIALVVIVGIGIYVYISIPSLSVGLAGAQAGINATYPEYKPEGYNLTRPIQHDNNQVEIKFSSTTNDTYFIIKQTKSSWDSTAVKDQVEKDSGGEFITTEERGLTIFSYSGNAAWANGGILYTINGTAALTSDQIRRIATSL